MSALAVLSTPRGWPLLVLCVGCAADLLPGELVVPGELTTSSFHGEPGESLGAGVAVDQGAILAGAPGAGQARMLGQHESSQGPDGMGRWVWWDEGLPFAARSSAGVYGVDQAAAELLWETPGALAFAAGPMEVGFRVAASTGAAVQLWDGEGSLLARLDMAWVQRLAVGARRVLLQACESGDCQVWAWTPSSDSLEALGSSGHGGAVVEVDGVAWWGDPQLDDPEGRGLVFSEAGQQLEGLPGDHLGRSICDSHVAGVFNSWIVPARLRLVPLEGGSVLSIDHATPSRAPVLACEEGLVVVGLPADGTHEHGEGRVLVVELGS